MKIPLDVSFQATFVQGATAANNDTVATVEMSPRIYGVTWNIKSYRVKTNSPQTYGPSTFFLYRSFIGATNELDSTYQGDGTTDGDANYEVSGSDKLIGVWYGADLGSQATISLRGEVETGRQ